METISSLPRRLTQLYSDTKTSCNAVVEQDAPSTQPEANALHRKFRLQKDRLIAWGLQWSDNTKGKHEDIDESIEQAGLADTVTSVLGIIKDILDEAERIHPPGAHAGAKTLSEKGGGRPSDVPSWAASERSRYEGLATDLTTAIDVLYDLSKSQRTHRVGSRNPSPSSKPAYHHPRPITAPSVYFHSEYNASDLTLINPATLPAHSSVPNTVPTSNLPPRLSPSDLLLPQEEPQPYESVGGSSPIRVIGKLRTRNSSTNPWKTDGNKTIETPVLIEYAAFDPTYRLTGVTPSLDRLESLLSVLSRLTTEQFHATLTCLGYFEDPKQPRFGLVFELPSFVYSGPSDSHKQSEELQPATLLSVLQTGAKSVRNANSAIPPLEDRFRLAFALTHTFSKLHGEKVVHKDVNSSNILVFRKNRRQSRNSEALQYAFRSPVICSFDLFSEYDISSTTTAMHPQNIYRHPEDPKYTGEKGKEYGPQFDLYSLGLILLEIGLWFPLSDIWKSRYTLSDFKQRVEENYIRKLAAKCGTAYMQAVRDCFWAADRITSGAESLENFPQLYNRICIRLQRCCLLDEVDPSIEFSEPNYGPSIGVSSPLKRKNINPTQTTELPGSPTHRSAKRWVSEKSTEVLERTRSLSMSKQSPRNSPNPSSLTRHGSQQSQHSIRKSISHLISPREEPIETMDWQPSGKRSLEGLGITRDTPPEATAASIQPEEPSDASLQRDEVNSAASTIQRAWRASHQDSSHSIRGSMSFRDYKEKITIIQKAWRKRKAAPTNTKSVQTLVTVATPSAILGCTSQREAPYPTPEPEVQLVDCTRPDNRYITSSIQIQRDMEASARPKLRLHPIKFPPDIVDEWHDTMLPRLERLIERALRDSDETISIDLVAVGETPDTVRPTIFVTCSSVPKVKAILSRKFRYDGSVYDLKVRRGKVRRSKANNPSRRQKLPHRSMMNTDLYNGDIPVMNPYHQQRPVCGASIGAFRGEHLPPVSYGGVILVDDAPMGMSVHHLLDAPSDEDSDSGSDDEAVSPGAADAVLSSARGTNNPWLMGMGSQPGVQIASSSPEPMWDLEITDDEAQSDDEDKESYDFSDSEYASEDESDDDQMIDSITSTRTIGDISGIPLGEGDEIRITQPAIDDVDDDFFPCEEDRDDDHLESHELGYVHASSGIRRWKRDGILHEIDWALLKLKEERLQPYNLVQGGRRFGVNHTVERDQRDISSKLEHPIDRRHYTADEDEYPNGVTSADRLGGLNVHCFGRTTGLQGGMVGSAMSSVRIYRRKTFSRSWHVTGGFGGKFMLFHLVIARSTNNEQLAATPAHGSSRTALTTWSVMFSHGVNATTSPTYALWKSFSKI